MLPWMFKGQTGGAYLGSRLGSRNARNQGCASSQLIGQDGTREEKGCVVRQDLVNKVDLVSLLVQAKLELGVGLRRSC